MHHFLKQSIWTILLTILSVAVVMAQGASCSLFLDDALLAVGDNCDETGRNEACYGYNQISASFVTEVDDNFFVQEADIAAVGDIERIATAPLDVEEDIWGVAVMNVQADLPNTIPGQTVTFLLMGDVEVENAVDPDNAFVPSDGIDVTVTASAGANLRSGPGLNFNVLGGAQFNATLLADGLSEDGEWLRVVYRERPAWVSRSVIDDTTEGIADLPTLSPDLQTAMQSFYLRTGIGEPECEDFPDDILIIQGPEDIEVNITANGADISIGSTIGLRIVEIDGELFLQAIAFSGRITFMGQVLRPGQFSVACLGDADSRGLDGEDNDLIVTCDPSPPEPLEGYGRDWCVLEQIPRGLLNYALNILCEGETPAQTGNGGGSQAEVPGYNCNTFNLISPLAPVDASTHTFSWSPVTPSNGTYQLVFYNFEGVEVESFYTTETSYSLNLGAETSTGGEFFWTVRFYDPTGAYVCVAPNSPVLTRLDASVPPPSAPFSASKSACTQNRTGQYETTVSWSNAPQTPVTIEWDDYNRTQSTNSNQTTGSVGIATLRGANGFSSILVISGGETINLGGCP